MKASELACFCLNMDKRTDRWEKAKRQLKAFGIQAERISGPEYKDSPHRGLSAGQAGCLDGHRRIWEEVLSWGITHAIIFEDDFVLPSDFGDVFEAAYGELPSDWILWQLHSFEAETTPAGQYITRIMSGGWGTHGYCITAEGCSHLLALSKKITSPADVLMTKDFIHSGKKLYGTRNDKALCFQRGEDSDILETSQTGYWRGKMIKFFR